MQPLELHASRYLVSKYKYIGLVTYQLRRPTSHVYRNVWRILIQPSSRRIGVTRCCVGFLSCHALMFLNVISNEIQICLSNNYNCSNTRNYNAYS